MSLISIVVPVFNEEQCLETLIQRLREVSEKGEHCFEYIFVDDGSTDQSLEIIENLSERYSDIKYISFSRNFGHEVATTAGLDHTHGDAVLIMDADLQDPPELIPEMVRKWEQGYHIVFARRRSRKGERAFKRITSWLFYRIIRGLTDVDIPANTGDFRLMDRCVVEHFRRCREQSRFVRGLVAWVGFKQTAVLYDRKTRHAGETKYGAIKLLILGIDAVLGFSNMPLRVGVLTGLSVCLICICIVASILIQKVFLSIAIPGYALVVTGIFFLGGVQLCITGLVGEYIGRIYRQCQNRPLYIIASKSKSLPQAMEGWYRQVNGSMCHVIDSQQCHKALREFKCPVLQASSDGSVEA